jgi:hypothetical protein
MRRSFAQIGVIFVALLLLYVMMRLSAPSGEATGEVPADTMCFAARLGLRCVS